MASYLIPFTILAALIGFSLWWLQQPIIWWLLAIISIGCAVAAWWYVPRWSADNLRSDIPDAKARADVEDNFRKSIGQLLGGAAVIMAAALAYDQTQSTLLTQRNLMERTLKEQDKQSTRTLINQQISKGFELLGDSDVTKRIGGINTLEGVFAASTDYVIYHQSVLRGLSAFVRIKTSGDQEATQPLFRADVDEALAVIVRHAPASRITLARARISFANLNDANFRVADFCDADLSNAELRQVNFSSGTLVNTRFNGANMYAAILVEGNLNGATLVDAALQVADLTRATLRKANFTRAKLSNARLESADLKDAIFDDAVLDGADLSGALNVTQTQLDAACGTGVKLPSAQMKVNPCK